MNTFGIIGDILVFCAWLLTLPMFLFEIGRDEMSRTRTPIVEDEDRPIVFDGLDAPLVDRQDLRRFLA